ncbi:lytic transglycosylase domain-containing protein [Cryobacterium sp. 1639]|uniref:aggregation-promoting factor C-terminal-like domain-containing protein n=1 Tax=Cryobacterium inferilacus TaxID=2866629 RepID=UPI001C72E38E|nr:lytic transglycosylase domain-containing protein [Cryobacterium sp. 1639]MBX0300358.1 lytic transglycosylase domain-containing protein [Cryobacterium sp. 1639]
MTQRDQRATHAHHARVTRRTAAGVAVLVVGAMVGTGFVLQPAMAAQNDRVAETAALTESTGLHSEQLRSYSAIAAAHAEKAAEGTIAGATAVVTAAQNKADATDLATSVAMLSDYEQLAPERIYDLVDTTNTQVAPVQSATAEADRIAAEAAAAAAAAEAAAQAAAEEAAAEEAAAASAAQEAQAAPQASSAPAPSAPSNPSGAQAIARDMMSARYGWGGDQFGCLVSLWDKESGWNASAYNASSGATGIPQALPGSKMASAGADWATNPATQISWGLGYISGSYGTPCAAWAKSEAVGWY